MNSGIGVSEKFITAALELRTSCASPASPPRNSMAPIRLMTMKENATGMPMNKSTVDPPSSSSAAICQDMAIPSGRRDRVVARPHVAPRQPVHAEDELEREQREGERHRHQQRPFGQHQRLDRQRAVGVARGRDARAVPDEDQAADDA